MKRLETRFPEAALFELVVRGDDRGRFLETYRRERYRELGLDFEIVQSNVSVSAKGVLRGLHAQMPSPQGKLVTVLAGRVWDVIVDARLGSPRYGEREGFDLSAENGRQLWVPPGFLHGFLSQEDGSLLSYHVDAAYDPAGDFSVRWDDPDLGIGWPLETAPILSAKDEAAPLLRDLPPERLLPYAP